MSFLNFGGRQAQAVNVAVDDFAITANVDNGNPDAPKSSEVDYSLYLVAKAIESPGYDAFAFDATTPFKDLGSLINSLNNASQASMSAGELSSLAQSAAGIVASSPDIAPSKMTRLGSTASNLQAGLYLLVVTPAGADVAALEGHGLVQSKDKWVSYAYGDTIRYAFDPQLVTVPTRALTSDITGSANTADTAPWQSSINITLKYTESSRTGSLEIVKELPEIAEVGGVISGTTFVFSINGTRDGQLVYSNVVSITFDAAGSKSVIVDNIPIDLDITVTEAYSGATYTPEGDTVKHVSIQPTDGLGADAAHATVTFTNSYDSTNNRGGAVVNSFENGEGRWKHEKEVA